VRSLHHLTNSSNVAPYLWVKLRRNAVSPFLFLLPFFLCDLCALASRSLR